MISINLAQPRDGIEIDRDRSRWLRLSLGPGGSRSAFYSSFRCPDRARSVGSVRGVAHGGHGKARARLAWRTEGPIATHAPRVAVSDHASGSEPTRPVWTSPFHSSRACRAPGVVPPARRAWCERRCEHHILPIHSHLYSHHVHGGGGTVPEARSAREDRSGDIRNGRDHRDPIGGSLTASRSAYDE